jgi:hypothetical protein
MAIIIGLSVIFSLSSCRRLKVGADFDEIEWVVVTCHTEGFHKPWVAKLTPKSDAKLIRQLMEAIHAARWRGASEAGGEGFIVFKLKGGGVRSFNFAPWESGQGVEIRSGFRSRELAKVLETIGDGETGWRRDDSLPELKVRAIEVWQYGRKVTELAPDSPSFASLLPAAMEALKTLDPRLCMPALARRDPRQVALHQGAPQFILSLEEPLDMHKLVVWRRIDDPDVPRVRYESFRSSTILIYMERFEDRIGFHYIAFQSDSDASKWYDWEVAGASGAAKALGKPDAREAFKSLLDTYNQLAAPER